MKLIKNRRADLILLAAIGVTVLGFRLVTQAGQAMAAPQNDGYAATGGVILIAAGVLYGLWFRLGKQ